MSGIFSPGQAAEQSGFSLDTLGYYERIGLLDGIDRVPSGVFSGVGHVAGLPDLPTDPGNVGGDDLVVRSGAHRYRHRELERLVPGEPA